MKLRVETGDVSRPQIALRSFQVERSAPLPTKVVLSFSDVSGELDIGEWPSFLEQVTEAEFVNRVTPELLEPPMGRESLVSVLQQISSTATLQLFLAAADIAERIEFVSESSYEWVRSRFLVLRGWMPSVTGSGGLFFVPENVLNAVSRKAVEDLIRSNKLCSATLSGDANTVQRLYVPYATPIGFVGGPVGDDARRLWDEVRSLYYNSRQAV